MPVWTQVGTPVQSYTRANPRGTPCVSRRFEARDFACESAYSVCWACGAEDGGAGFGFDFGSREVSSGVDPLREEDREEAIERRDWSMSATTIFVKGWVVARAEARRRPIAPAPKTRAAVGSETDEEMETSSAVGGLER